MPVGDTHTHTHIHTHTHREMSTALDAYTTATQIHMERHVNRGGSGRCDQRWYVPEQRMQCIRTGMMHQVDTRQGPLPVPT